jgi:L,D-transpeptidase YcbB
MRTNRLDRFLAGTAVALVLPVALALSASAQDANAPPAAIAETAPPATAAEAAKPATSAEPASSVAATEATKPDAQTGTVKEPAAVAETAKPAEAVDTASPAAMPPESPKQPTTTVETQPPAPAAPLESPKTAEAAPPVDANAPVAEKLRALSSGKFDRLIGGRGKRDEIAKFYEARNYAPLWIDNGALGARGKAAAAYLAGVAADGLEPADYPVPKVAAGADADALATAELRLTDSVLDFAKHAESGRVHYTRISADISFDLERPVPADVLKKLAASHDIAATLDSFNPQQPGYKALKVALAKARGGAPEEKSDVVIIGGGKMLRQGSSDPRVVDLRKRLGVTANTTSQEYDDAVAEAVKAFQKDKGLGADGVLGPNTLRAMNGKHQPSKDPVATILANMERWRWLPRDLGRTYVMVNIPDFTLRVVRDNKLVWSTKIVVGKPRLKTPLMSASMKYITVNPTWNVPPSIIRNEYLPVIQQDPNALERIGLKMEQNRDGTIRIYQPPGARNALGRIRFNFPNKFLVYQHDTPDKHLFAREARAFSHGCMRVQDPIKYGEVLLSLTQPGKGYSEKRLRSMFGGSEININFPKPIPVHLTYQTAFVDDGGKLQLRNDVYGYDASVLSWLKGDQRRVADIGIVRPKSSSSKPVMMPDSLITRDRGAPNFFERLFGVESDPEPVFEPRRRYRRFGGGPSGFN